MKWCGTPEEALERPARVHLLGIGTNHFRFNPFWKWWRWWPWLVSLFLIFLTSKHKRLSLYNYAQQFSKLYETLSICCEYLLYDCLEFQVWDVSHFIKQYAFFFLDFYDVLFHISFISQNYMMDRKYKGGWIEKLNSSRKSTCILFLHYGMLM